MSDKRIYELTEASVVGADDLLALDSSEFSETKKIKMNTLTKGLVHKESLTNLIINSDTNNTGSTITKGTVFYLYGELCIALVDIASGAEFTPDTNYDNITIGGQIAELKSDLSTQWISEPLTDTTHFNSSSYIKYRIVGNILFVNIRANLMAQQSLAGNTSYQIFTLPVGFRPDWAFRYVCNMITGYEIHDVLQCGIDTDGSIKLFNENGISSLNHVQEMYCQFCIALRV